MNWAFKIDSLSSHFIDIVNKLSSKTNEDFHFKTTIFKNIDDFKTLIAHQNNCINEINELQSANKNRMESLDLKFGNSSKHFETQFRDINKSSKISKILVIINIILTFLLLIFIFIQDSIKI